MRPPSIWTVTRWPFSSVPGSSLPARYALTEEAAGKRIWFRHVARPKLDASRFLPGLRNAEFFVCVRPGECRFERPTGELDVVIDLPECDEVPSSFRLLERAIDSGAEELASLLPGMRNIVTGRYQDDLMSFWNNAFEFLQDDQRRGESIGYELYRDYFVSCRLQGAVFAPALVLVDLQSQLGKWIDVEQFQPQAGLSLFVYWCSYEHPKIPSEAAELGNRHYDAGQKWLRHALESRTLARFYECLVGAAQSFLAAGIIATRLAELGDRLELGVLEYDKIRAEEGFANAPAGLCHRIDDFLAGELPAPEFEWANWYRQGRADEVDASFKSLTRITNPLLPRHYAEVGRAAALTMAGEQWRVEGIRKLEQLAHEWIASFEAPGIELERIYRCLMQGHLLAGNEDAAKVAASQMALAKRMAGN